MIVFAVGFVLGTGRVLLITPRFGETDAVLLELPVMLALSWIACTSLVRRFAVSPGIAERLGMGGVAFALLMLGELGVSVFGLGRTVAEHLASYQTISVRLGLAAQIGFALFPLIHASFNSPDLPLRSGVAEQKQQQRRGEERERRSRGDGAGGGGFA
jgi:hypothetical protein